MRDARAALVAAVAATATLALPLAAGCGGGSVGDSADAAPPGTPDAMGADARPVITPDDPGPADVRFELSSEARHPVSRYIYGENGADFGANPGLTLTRSGGNRLTAYNWENNASNAGTDYLNQNDAYLGGGDLPGEVARLPIADAFAHGASAIITVPIQGYVAADKGPGGDVNQTPNYLDARFEVSKAKKGAAFTTTPPVADGFVYQDEFVALMEGKFPGAHGHASKNIFYCLDNEPDLWSSTHPRIHPSPVGYQELLDRNLEYAGAIKDVAPTALVFGLVSYGWAGYVTLQGAPDGAGRDFLDFYLDGLATAGAAQGRRLVDVLDLHWYPEARGGGVRITDDGSGAALAEARKQAPRSLWDPTYQEDSWIANDSVNGPIRLLPLLRDKIAAHYPGTKIAFTEYYYGGGAHISGAIAQADVLGIFGREGVFAATLWHLGQTNDSMIHAAFRMFRDYDGQGGAFGDDGIAATTDDVAGSSVYAALVGDEKLVIVAINKTGGARTAGVRLRHGVRFGTAAVYRLTSAQAAPVGAPAITIDKVNAFTFTMPAESVTTLVLTP